jgi:hypothetical protein
MNATEIDLARTLVRCIRVAYRSLPPPWVSDRRAIATNMLEVFCEQMDIEKETIVQWARELGDHAFGYWGEIKDEVIPAFEAARTEF